MTRHLPALLVLVLLLAGCASSDPGAQDDPTDPTTAAPTATADTAAPDPATTAPPASEPTAGAAASPAADVSLPATGTLGGEQIEGGCVYVEIDGTRYELVPAPDADLVIDSGNFVVATPGGEVIARAGDQITVDGTLDAGLMTFCQIGPVIAATSVEAA